MIKYSRTFIWFSLSLLFAFITLNSFSQNMKGENAVQANSDSHLLSEVLKKLETDFGITFMFDPEIIKNKKVEKIEAKGKFEQRLITILSPLNLSFKKIHKNYYVIQAIGNN